MTKSSNDSPINRLHERLSFLLLEVVVGWYIGYTTHANAIAYFKKIFANLFANYLACCLQWIGLEEPSTRDRL